MAVICPGGKELEPAAYGCHIQQADYVLWFKQT